MEDKIVEIMARAAYEHHCSHVPIPADWRTQPPSERKAWRDEQRAVIAALSAAGCEIVQWQNIRDVPVATKGFAWSGGWRSAFPATVTDPELFRVYVDTCEIEARGRMETATHFAILRGPQGE